MCNVSPELDVGRNPKKRNKAIGALTAAAAAAAGNAQADVEEIDDLVTHYEYDTDGDGTEEWNYVDHWSVSTSEDQKYSANKDDSVDANQTVGLSLAYSDFRNRGTWYSPQYWYPSTDNHLVDAEVGSSPDGAGGIRITDPQTQQQGESDTELSPAAEAAVGYLVSVASAAVKLPLPNPLDFMPDEASLETIEENTQRVEYKFNDDPPVQGIDWLAYTISDVEVGTYRLHSGTRVDAGFRVDTAPHSTEESMGHLLANDFTVYR